jgi:hypothetical protein
VLYEYLISHVTLICSSICPLRRSCDEFESLTNIPKHASNHNGDGNLLETSVLRVCVYVLYYTVQNLFIYFYVFLGYCLTQTPTKRSLRRPDFSAFAMMSFRFPFTMAQFLSFMELGAVIWKASQLFSLQDFAHSSCVYP